MVREVSGDPASVSFSHKRNDGPDVILPPLPRTPSQFLSRGV